MRKVEPLVFWYVGIHLGSSQHLITVCEGLETELNIYHVPVEPIITFMFTGIFEELVQHFPF